MSYVNADPYYQPEKFGLKIVEEVRRPGLRYEFDMAVLWQHDDGTYYWSTDKGCSCPSPFEWARGLADLNRGLAGWEEARKDVVRGHA